MEKETKNYVESLNQDPNWLKEISIEINKFFINFEYIDFFMQMYMTAYTVYWTSERPAVCTPTVLVCA